ncbi:alpha/beta fold hydrolase [Glycomyces sp. NPDC048151]|uniref:alpha/beta fold hydrolase n=1 Tax=Glycomyces sp. NPDC048151 TaxID=3364002 RepID=UPI0037150DB9
MNSIEPAGQHTGFTSQSRMSIQVRGTQVAIAASSNTSESDELVLLLHGLGCSRESFGPVYTGDEQRRWLAIDLPGHGDSSPIGHGGDLMGHYADVVIELVTQLAPRTVHLVAHSMGLAVALIAAPSLPVGALVAIEGNLTGEDCGLVSRSIAEMPESAFMHAGHAVLRDQLLGSDQTDMRIWGNWIERADPGTLWQASASLVTWCDSGGVAARWSNMGRRTYLRGERSGYPEHLGALLAGVEVVQIGGAGHFPMVDNPIVLSDTITAAIERGAGAE